MTYTLREAAAACGHNKSSVLRALKSGKINGARNQHGGWEIEPGELHRLWPVASPPAPTTRQKLALAEARVSEVETKLQLAIAEGRVSHLEAHLSRLEAELADVRTQRDNWMVLAQTLLTTRRKSWWPFW
jgi:hypothetical protein